MRYLLLICLVGSLALFAFAGSGLADPPDMLLDPVPAHRHFVSSPTGALVPIGPQICGRTDDAGLQKAFNQFHHNVHHSFFPGIGVIHTLGPQDGAPGLNNSRGAEIMARGCEFTG